jgi:hypothetical protein
LRKDLKYCIDTSFLLDAWRRKYPPDHFPPFWEYLGQLIETGEMRAPEEVFYDLRKKDDDVFRWAKDRKATLFVPIDNQIQQEVSAILAKFEKLIDTRRGRSSSDPWVIALAKLNSATLITNENRSIKPTPSRPTIPDVCAALNIRYIDTLRFIRDERIVFNTFVIR